MRDCWDPLAGELRFRDRSRKEAGHGAVGVRWQRRGWCGRRLDCWRDAAGPLLASRKRGKRGAGSPDHGMKEALMKRKEGGAGCVRSDVGGLDHGGDADPETRNALKRSLTRDYLGGAGNIDPEKRKLRDHWKASRDTGS